MTSSVEEENGNIILWVIIIAVACGVIYSFIRKFV